MPHRVISEYLAMTSQHTLSRQLQEDGMMVTTLFPPIAITKYSTAEMGVSAYFLLPTRNSMSHHSLYKKGARCGSETMKILLIRLSMLDFRVLTEMGV